MTVAGANRKNAAATTGSTARSRKSLSDNSSAAAAQTPTQALRVSVSETATSSAGRTRAAHDTLAFAEQQTRKRGADNEHQQARIRHVVAERALRPPAEVVVVKDRVLKDPVRGADGAERQDDGDHRFGAPGVEQAIRHRHQGKQDELLAVDETRPGLRGQRGRHERQRCVRCERPEHARHRDRFAAGHEHGGPAEHRHGQQDLTGGNRELNGPCGAIQGQNPSPFQAVCHLRTYLNRMA